MSEYLNLPDDEFDTLVLVKISVLEVLVDLIWTERLLSDDASPEEAAELADDLKEKALGLVRPSNDPFDKLCRIALEERLDAVISRIASL